jgi:hypothetical protein
MCAPPIKPFTDSATTVLQEEAVEQGVGTVEVKEVVIQEVVVQKAEGVKVINNEKKKHLSPERLAAIKKMETAAELLKNGPEKMMVEQALSLRKQMLVDKIVNNGWRMRNLSDKLRIAYDAGSTLPELCMRYVRAYLHEGVRMCGCVYVLTISFDEGLFCF